MKGLLIKDFGYLGLNKKIFSVIIAVIVVAFLIGGNNSASFLSGFLTSYLAVMMGFQVMGSITYDEYKGGLAYIMTMPITRCQYVLSKYIYAAILTVIGALAGYAVSLTAIIITEGTGNVDLASTVAELLTVYGVVILLNAIMIPVQLKYGSDKGKMVIFVLVAIVMVSAFASERIGSALGVDIDKVIYNIKTGLDNMSMVTVSMVSIVVMCLGLLVSFLISMRVVNNKEF